MLQNNLKSLRTQAGLSQEELAERLGVVRQTISKWETGLSVPDADSLVRLAEVFGVPVGTLLGETIEPEAEQSEVQLLAQKLEALNAEPAARRARSRKWMRTGGILLIVAALLWTICAALPLTITRNSASIGIIGGADGPTTIFVTGIDWVWAIIGGIVCLAAFIIGIILLRKARKK